MKTLRYIFAVGALFVLAGCFKDVAYKTELILRPTRQTSTGGLFDPLEGVQGFVCNVDTTLWRVASYDDALKGIITSKENPAEKITATVLSQPYEAEGAVGWISLPLSKPSQMVVVVDTQDKVFAYTQQKLEVNLPKLYIDLAFRTWKEGKEYKDGNWVYRNEFYVVPPTLQCIVAPRTQAAEGGEDTALTTAEVYAFYADTTEWYIASYADAVGRKITRKDDPSKKRTTPEALGYLDKETGTYKMEVRNSVLMLVVADKSTDSERYAYSKQTVDLEGAPVTFPIVLRTWKTDYIYVEDGWRVVDQKRKPVQPETPTPSNRKR